MKIALLAMLMIGCGGDKDTAGDTSSTATTPTGNTTAAHPALDLTGDSTAGEAVYAANCSGCHGADATGGIGPDLTEHSGNLSDEEIVLTIAEGSGNMAAVAISDQEIADVLAWLRANFSM